MKKLLGMVVLVFLSLTACGRGEQTPPQLIFNPVEVTSVLSITRLSYDSFPFTEAQIREVFPGLGSDMTATMHFYDGVLKGVTGWDNGIQVTLGENHLFEWRDYGFGAGPHQSSDMHGVEVTAFLVQKIDQPFLQVNFRMGDIVYRISTSPHGIGRAEQARVREVVGRLVLGGLADWGALSEVSTVEAYFPSDRVIVISGGIEHRPYVNMEHAWGGPDGIHASGPFRRPQNVANELVAFSFEEDFQVVLRGEPDGAPSYFLHHFINGSWVEDGRWGSACVESLLAHSEPGEYMLEARIVWSDEWGSIRLQYFFRFIVTEELRPQPPLTPIPTPTPMPTLTPPPQPPPIPTPLPMPTPTPYPTPRRRETQVLPRTDLL